MSVKRFFGPAMALAVLLILASGIYIRIRGTDSTEETGTSDVSELPGVSAGDAFRTDVAIPVIGSAVTRDTLVKSVSAAAEAAPWRESKIVSRVEGIVLRIPVRENQRVGAGAVAVAIDTTDLAIALARAEAELANAEANYRQVTLFDDREPPEIREERAKIARSQSGLDRAELDVRKARLDLERATLRAPFQGRVSDIAVSEGHRVGSGDELMTIVDIDPIRVEVQVIESEIGFLTTGRQAQVTFSAFPGEAFVGRVASINPVVDRQTRTARVTVEIPNSQGRILPGMYARVSIEAQKFPDRIIVPKSAILERDRRTMLFVFQPDGSAGLAKWVYVTTGLENDSLIEIVSNPDTEMLEPGQIVLTDGHYTLTHDARVQISNDLSGPGGRPMLRGN